LTGAAIGIGATTGAAFALIADAAFSTFDGALTQAAFIFLADLTCGAISILAAIGEDTSTAHAQLIGVTFDICNTSIADKIAANTPTCTLVAGQTFDAFCAFDITSLTAAAILVGATTFDTRARLADLTCATARIARTRQASAFLADQTVGAFLFFGTSWSFTSALFADLSDFALCIASAIDATPLFTDLSAFTGFIERADRGDTGIFFADLQCAAGFISAAAADTYRFFADLILTADIVFAASIDTATLFADHIFTTGIIIWTYYALAGST
jgi:hypothetical protein